MKRFLLWLLEKEIQDMVAEEIKNIVDTITESPNRRGYYYFSHTKMNEVKIEIESMTRDYFGARMNEVRKEAAKDFWKEVNTEEFIDKMIERINKKQIKAGVKI